MLVRLQSNPPHCVFSVYLFLKTKRLECEKNTNVKGNVKTAVQTSQCSVMADGLTASAKLMIGPMEGFSMGGSL